MDDDCTNPNLPGEREGGSKHHPLSENLMNLRPVCKFEFVRWGQVKKNSALSFPVWWWQFQKIQEHVFFQNFLFFKKSGDEFNPFQGGEAAALHFWHEPAIFQRSAFGRSTAGNDVVATIPISLFFLSAPLRFPPLLPFLRRDLYS